MKIYQDKCFRKLALVNHVRMMKMKTSIKIKSINQDKINKDKMHIDKDKMLPEVSLGQPHEDDDDENMMIFTQCQKCFQGVTSYCIKKKARGQCFSS